MSKEQRKKIPPLSTIYHGDGRSLREMKRIDRWRDQRRRGLMWVILFFLIAAGTSFAGFAVFNRQEEKTTEKVKLTFDAPKTLASGEEVTFEMTYVNEDVVDIEETDLTVLYPEGFYFTHSDRPAENDAKTFWKLGMLPAGEAGRLRITGQLLGEIHETKTFVATINYTPSNFHSVFEEKGSHSLEITSSIVDLGIDIPLRMVGEREAAWTIRFENKSEFSLNDIKMTVIYPEGYVFGNADPAPSQEKNIWTWKNLAKNVKREIKLQGIFQGRVGEMKSVVVQLGTVRENGEVRLQAEKSVLVNFVNPELLLEFSHKKSKDESVAKLGDILEYTIVFKNASDVEMKNVVLKADFKDSANLLDFSKVDDSQKGKVEGQSILWSMNEVEELASLVPNEEGRLSFKIPTVASFSPRKETDRHLMIEGFAKVVSLEVEELQGGGVEKSSESNHVKTKIVGKVVLEAEGRYYSEDFEKLGSGPLPPEVGKTTTYRLTWSVKNFYNDLKNVKIEAVLPPDVTWTGRSSSSAEGFLKFDPETRKITWKMKEIVANTGVFIPPALGTFEVSITPSRENVGKLMVLLQESGLEGKDGWTKREMKAKDRIITTDLAGDQAAAGRGTIVTPSSVNPAPSY